MYKKLEEFVEDNRNAFDSDKPSEKVWQNIKSGFEEHKKQNLFFSRSFIIKTISIAAAVILVVFGVWYFFYTGTNKIVTKNNVSNSSLLKKDSTQIQQPNEANTSSQPPKESDDKLNNNEYTKELYYYTRLAEIKYNQLKTTAKEEPLIYKNFSEEIKKLNSTYQSLENLLADNPNKEAILHAMTNTIKIQVEILNKQLEIIHTIKQAKKGKYENKTI